MLFALLLLIASATCLFSKSQKKADVYDFLKMTKTLTVDVTDEDNTKLSSYGGALIEKNDESRSLVIKLTQKDMKEGEEEKSSEVLKNKFVKLYSEASNQIAVYFADSESNEVEQWNEVFHTEMPENWTDPININLDGKTLIIRLVSYQALQATIVNEDSEQTIISIKRMAQVDKKSQFSRMILPILAMLPMQYIQYKQRKKMMEQQNQQAQQTQAQQPQQQQQPQQPQEGQEGNEQPQQQQAAKKGNKKNKGNKAAKKGAAAGGEAKEEGSGAEGKGEKPAQPKAETPKKTGKGKGKNKTD